MVKGKTNGKASSEYILALVGMVGGMVIASIEGFQGESSWLTLAGASLTDHCYASYTSSRATAQTELADAEAHTQVATQNTTTHHTRTAPAPP